MSGAEAASWQVPEFDPDEYRGSLKQVEVEGPLDFFSDLDFAVGIGTDLTYLMIIGAVLRAAGVRPTGPKPIRRAMQIGYRMAIITDEIKEMAHKLDEGAKQKGKTITDLTVDERREILFNVHPDVFRILTETNLKLPHDAMLEAGYDHVDPETVAKLRARGAFVRDALSIFDHRGIYTSVSTQRGETVMEDMEIPRLFSPILSEHTAHRNARNDPVDFYNLISAVKQNWYGDSDFSTVLVFTDDNAKHILTAKKASIPGLHPYHVHELARPYEIERCRGWRGKPDEIMCIPHLGVLKQMYVRKVASDGPSPRAVAPVPSIGNVA